MYQLSAQDHKLDECVSLEAHYAELRDTAKLHFLDMILVILVAGAAVLQKQD